MVKRHGIPRERLCVSGGITPEQLVRDSALNTSARFFLNIEEISKYLFLREHSQEAPVSFAGLTADGGIRCAEWRTCPPGRRT